MDDVFLADDGFMVISAGRYEAECAALAWAIAHGVRHGGWQPDAAAAGFPGRIDRNVLASDATLIVTLHERLPGAALRTALCADRLGKPWLHIRPHVHPKYVARFLTRHGVATVNVAGAPEPAAQIGELVRHALAGAIHLR